MQSIALKNGLFLGLAFVVSSLLTYLISPNTMLSMSYGWVTMILFISFFMWRTASQMKEKNEGFLSFGEAFGSTWLTAAVGLLISTIFSYILLTIIDPSLVEILKENSIAAIEKMSSFMGEDAAAEAIEKMEEQDFTPKIGTTMLNYIFVLLFPTIFISLIVSAFTKKNNDQFA